MLTLSGSLFVGPLRLLLSLVARFRPSFGRIALILRTRLSSLWRSILTLFARYRGQPHFRLHASNAVTRENSNPSEGHQPSPEPAEDPEKRPSSGTLAALPIRSPAVWEEELLEYKDPVSASPPFEFYAYPAIPIASQRYNPKTLKPNNGPTSIPAGQQTLVSATKSKLPDHWRRHVHPEGVVFFYHERLRIFTEIEVNPDSNSKILFYATKLIQMALETDGVTLDEFTELVLNVNEEEWWWYYFVDHKNRLLFWVEPIEPREVLGTGLQVITGYSHIKYLVEAWYWYASSGSRKGMCTLYVVCDMESRSHCQYYPNERTLPKGVFQDLERMLNYAMTDMVTAGASTSSSFSRTELVTFLDITKSLKDKTISDSCSVWIISRLMKIFLRHQFLNFYGQPCAGSDIDTTLFEKQAWNHGVIFRIISVFLFGSPNEHAIHLQRILVDGTILQSPWVNFIEDFKDELGRCSLLSTVMLTADLAFLAVLGVDFTAPYASVSEILIYCSLAMAVASIVFHFVLSSRYGVSELKVTSTMADNIWILSQTTWGMPSLAITHSLPSACLVWSITFFSTALAILVFGQKELATIITLSIECFILVLLGNLTGLVLFRSVIDLVLSGKATSLAFLGKVADFVMRPFRRNDGVDTFEQHDLMPTSIQQDPEQGSER